MQLVGGQRPTLEEHDAESGEIYGLAYIRWDGQAYAPRSFATHNPYRVVVWIGPTPPPINDTYARDNIDLWWKIQA